MLDPYVLPSLSMVKPAHAVTGELPSVCEGSGVGERAARPVSAARCEGRYRGGEGEEVDVGPSDVTSCGGDAGSVLVEVDGMFSAGSNEGESLRFL